VSNEEDTGFPKLSAPARRALSGAGYNRLDQLAEVSEPELRKLHGVGPTAIAAIRQALLARGLEFRDPVPDQREKVSAKEVDEYLNALDEPKRSTLQTLRCTILEIVPEADEVISYRLPAFRVRGAIVAGFAAFKTHLSYLPFSGSVLGQLGDQLQGYTMTKSALHFPVDRSLPKPLVQELIAVRLAEIERRSGS
jgi:uncharacterized protein YdhG (YjbR/CyaY superfamily)